LLAVVLTACGGGTTGSKRHGAGKSGAALTIRTTTLPLCRDGRDYRVRIRAKGGEGGYFYRLLATGDPLPPGLTLDPQRGRIEGRPDFGSGGAYFVEIEIADEAQPPSVVSRRFALVVEEPRNEFGAIADWILPNCTTTACHGAVDPAGELALDPPAEAHRQLVAVLAWNAEAGGAGKLRVVKGEPDRSFLMHKLLGKLIPAEGDPMPPDTLLSADQLDLVERWIESGAWFDPTNEFAPSEGGGGGGVVSIEIGRYDDDLYTAYQDGDRLVLLTGTQGGDWALPTFRTRGLDGAAHLEASLVLADGGEVVAALVTIRPLRNAPNGQMEVKNVLVPLLVPDVDEIVGEEAIFTVAITDSFGTEAEGSVRVELRRK
jgi:hypothetical protein